MEEYQQLFIIPIVHGEADLGSMAASVRARFDQATWAARQEAIDAWWDLVANWMRQLPSSVASRRFSDVQIYQDGMPVDAPITQIMNQLATAGSRNHKLLAEMAELGASIEGTESPELLLKELEMVKTASEGRGQDPRSQQRARGLLERRDRFIGERIGGTLRAGGRGVLLIGVAHKVEPYLPADVFVHRPVKPMSTQFLRQAG